MKKNIFSVRVFLCFVIGLPLILEKLQAQDITKTLMADGKKRNYILHLPPSYNSGEKYPVIVALHGGGGTAKNTIKFYNLDGLADENNFIIVYPDAINKAWNIPGMTSRVKKLDTTVNDIHFISLLLDTLTTHYNADEKRFFFTGISRGAMFSFCLASKLNDRVAAIAPVCGGISQTLAENYRFKKPVPVLMINGTADPLVSYNGGYGKFNKNNEENEDADMLPAEDLVKKIAAEDHCTGTPEIKNIPNINLYDGCTATESIYNCATVKFDFVKIINGGHTWPGGSQYLPKAIIGKVCRDFKAEEMIFDFFKNIK
ncbi:MAG: hypothetical protein JSU05_08860 [Bacteroidetes bacterium]|nr:hypothetical protein [Bacteroidota bacterium]